MAKDKRLLITRATVQHIQRKEGGVDKASKYGMFIQFIVPLRLLKQSSVTTTSVGLNSDSAQDGPQRRGRPGDDAKDKNSSKKVFKRGSTFSASNDSSFAKNGSGSATTDDGAAAGAPHFADKLYQLPNPVFRLSNTGRTTCLIVAHDIIIDALKINRKYKHFDAVVSIQSVSKLGDAEALKKGVQVANAFSRFVIDSRVVKELPRSIAVFLPPDDDPSKTSIKKEAHAALNTAKTSATTSSSTAQILDPTRKVVSYIKLDSETLETTDLPFVMSQAAKGQMLHASLRDGRCLLRVGHAGMTAGDITANVSEFTSTLKTLYPTLYRSIIEFKLLSAASEPIRYMATNAA